LEAELGLKRRILTSPDFGGIRDAEEPIFSFYDADVDGTIGVLATGGSSLNLFTDPKPGAKDAIEPSGVINPRLGVPPIDKFGVPIDYFGFLSGF
jgi:hypothetical protein